MAWDAAAPSWMTWGTEDGSDVEISFDPNHIPKQYGLAEHLMASHYVKTTRQRITYHDNIGIEESDIDDIGLDIISITHTYTERPVDGNPVPVVAAADPAVPEVIAQGKRWVKYLPPKICGTDHRVSLEIIGAAELALTLAATEAKIADFMKERVLGTETTVGATFVPKAPALSPDVTIAIGSGWTMLAPRNSTSPINPNGYTLEFQYFEGTATPTALTTHPLAAFVDDGTLYYGCTIAGIDYITDVDNAALDITSPPLTECFLVSVTDTLTAGANRPATRDITWTVMPSSNFSPPV